MTRAFSLRSLLHHPKELLSRLAFAEATGLTFDGLRSVEHALGYQDRLEIADFRRRFRRGGVARKLVEFEPKATWRAGIDVVEDPRESVTTPFEKDVSELFSRLGVWSILKRADTLAGLGRYAVVVIGDGRELGEELALNGPDSVLYLLPRAEDHAKINSYVDDAKDPRFGLPREYGVSISDRPGVSKTVVTHWSRVIHIADGLLESETYGTPRMEAAWNYLDDLTKVVGGGAEAFWNRADPGMHLKVDPEFAPSQDELEELDDEVLAYRHRLERTLRTTGVDIDLLQASASSFSDPAKLIIGLVAATRDIPQRIFLGSERGELASSQDESNWGDALAERRSSFAEPTVRALVNRLVDYGGVTPPTQEWEVRWPEEDELNESEKSEVSERYARANAALVSAGMGPAILSDELRAIIGQNPLEESGWTEAEDGDEDAEGATTEGFELAPQASRAALKTARKIVAVADRHEPRLTEVILAGWHRVADLISETALEEALRAGDQNAASQIVDQAIALAAREMLVPMPDEAGEVR